MIWIKAGVGTLGYWMMFVSVWQITHDHLLAGLVTFIIANVLCLYGTIAVAKYIFRQMAVEYAVVHTNRLYRRLRQRFES